jgi:hypothetical protein
VENTIEVRYAGVVVGRSTVVRDLGAAGTFIGLAEPMPVGTLVTLKMGDVLKEASVAEVIESADADAVGMRVQFDAGGVGALATQTVSDDESGAISAPLSLTGTEGQTSQPGGGGKKRRKRR